MELNRRTTTIVLGIILLTGAMLRLANLGLCAFRGDEFVFSTAQTGLVEIWRNPPWHNQIPLAESFCILFDRIIPGAVSHFTIRLPFALMGIAAILAVYAFCLRAVNRQTALLAAFMTAINPAQIYLSRDAYHYSGVILFSALTFWAFWGCWPELRQKRLPSKRAWTLWLLTGTLMSLTHMQTWFVFGVQWLTLLFSGLVAFKSERRSRNKLFLSLAVTAGLYALFISRWLYRSFGEMSDSKSRFGASLGDWAKFRHGIGNVIPTYLFGAWLPGIIITVIICVAVVLACRKNTELNRRVKHAALLFVATFCTLVFIVAVIGKGRVKITYFSSLFPLIMMLGAFGMLSIAEFSATKTGIRRIYFIVILVLGLCVYNVAPLKALLMLQGKTRPYKQIQHWIEDNLPEKKVVLVDGLCMRVQMNYYIPTNTTVTFLMPLMAMPDLKTKFKIKKQEKGMLHRFAQRFPDAIVLDYDRVLDAQLEGVINWDIDQYYRSRKVFTNSPALTLRKRRAVPGPSFYAKNLAGIITTLSYNTTQDILDMTAGKGRQFAVAYGGGWDFAKTRDYNNWHLLWKSANLQLLNSTDRSLRVKISIKGVASGGNKIVHIDGGGQVTFPANRLYEGKFPSLNIPPGVTKLTLSASGRETPLLVEQIGIEQNEEKQD